MKHICYISLCWAIAGHMMLPARVAVAQSEVSEAAYWLDIGLKEENAARKTEAFLKAVQLDPNFVEALYHLGLSHKSRRDYPRAEKFLLKAYSASTEQAEKKFRIGILYELVTTYQKLGRLPNYEESLRRVKSLANEPQIRAKVTFELGQIAFRDRRYKDALIELQEALQLDPALQSEMASLMRSAELGLREIDGLYAQAEKAQADGNFKQAQALLQQIQRKSPGYNNIDMRIAELEARLLKPVELPKAGEHFGERLETEYAEGMAALKARDWTAAILAFERVLIMDPSFRDTEKQLHEAQAGLDRESLETILARYYVEGVSAMDRNELGGALAALERVRKINPEYRDAAALIARIESALQQKTEIPPASPALVDSFYQNGVDASEKEDWMRAVMALEKVRLLQPHYRDVVDRLALARANLVRQQSATVATPAPVENRESIWLLAEIVGTIALLVSVGRLALSPSVRARYYVTRGDYAAAMNVYEKAVARNPGQVGFYPALADLYLLLNRKDPEALRIFKTVVQLNLETRQRDEINAIVAQSYVTEGRQDPEATQVMEKALRAEYDKLRQA